MMDAPQRTSLLKAENQASKAVQRKTASSRAKPKDLHVEALRSIVAFAELIGFQGGWGNFGDCHTELAEFLTTPQTNNEAQQKLRYAGDEKAAALRRLILMPRGHLKSTINTTLYTLWRLYRNPELRIFVGCNKQTLSFSFIRELRQWFENEELQKTVWNNRPHISGNLVPDLNTRTRQRNRNAATGDDTDTVDRKLIWNNTALQVNRESYFKEPSIFAGSVGTSATGQHYDLIILDDLIDFKNTESELRKERTEEWIQDIESILNPVQLKLCPGGFTDTVGGEMVISGTRYAVDDYYGFLLERLDELQYVSHVRNIFKNGIDNSAGYLWHEKYNDMIINALRARTTPRRFSSQYLNTVYEKDISLFDLSRVEVIDRNAVSYRGNTVMVSIGNHTEIVNPIVVIDPAFSTGKAGDDCAIIVGCKLQDGRTVLLDAACDRMEAKEVVKTTMEFCDRFCTLRVFHEANGVGLLVPELFKSKDTQVRGRLLVINSHYEQRPKEAKIQGVLEMPFALGNFVFAEHIWLNELIQKQIKNYPAVRHDDFLDALVTLFEKAIPTRSQKAAKANRDLKFSLNADVQLEKSKEPQPSILGAYNAYFQ
jgi:predicted phage terminase large subunit-like protein